MGEGRSWQATTLACVSFPRGKPLLGSQHAWVCQASAARLGPLSISVLGDKTDLPPPSVVGEPSWGEQVHSWGRGAGCGCSQCLFAGSPRLQSWNRGRAQGRENRRGFLPLLGPGAFLSLPSTPVFAEEAGSNRMPGYSIFDSPAAVNGGLDAFLRLLWREASGVGRGCPWTLSRPPRTTPPHPGGGAQGMSVGWNQGPFPVASTASHSPRSVLTARVPSHSS